jgi:hypothetical protein
MRPPRPRPTPVASAPRPGIALARGGVQLAVQGVHGVVGIVESMHQRVLGLAPPVGGWRDAPTRGITGLVYRSIRGTTSLVGTALDQALATAQWALPAQDGADARTPDAQEMALSALNGVLGDQLHASGNPLAIPLQLRSRTDHPQAASGHLLVVLHGLCMSDQQWTRQGHNHAETLSQALGCRPVYVRYNSGRHVAENGRELAQALESLVRNSPVPVTRITMLAHSMGGLVARAAVHAGLDRSHAWPTQLRDIVFLGTPHQGAPLEKGGNWVHALLGVSPYLAPFGRLAALRSAGITDLRHGQVLAGDPESDRFAHGRARPAPALPGGVRCFAVAGSIGPGLVGDGLVPVDSALGRHAETPHDLQLPPEHCRVVQGVGHLELLSSREVARQLQDWLAP